MLRRTFFLQRPVLKQSFRALSGTSDEVHKLESLLAEAKGRLAAEAAKQKEDEALAFSGKKFNIGTFNTVSKQGLQRFNPNRYTVSALDDGKSEDEVHAILLRSFKLGSGDVPDSVRAVARCGAGVNNIDIQALSERGIPVFNTPGANANAVKELVICSLFLASRGIVQGISHTVNLHDTLDAATLKKQVEKDKKQFGGVELTGKKLGVIGLGHIGAAVADTAISLGMDVVGYDPTIDVEAAWRLPGHVLQRATSLEELVSDVDYLSLHVPYMKETHHLLDKNLLTLMAESNPNASLVNFARGELVDSAALKELYDSGKLKGKYISDFPDKELYKNENVLILPHLGASTEEAESNSAQMAANQVIDFIETGSIRNSVNFPAVEIPSAKPGHARLCIVNRNVPGMLGLITTTLGSMGLNISQHINTSKNDLAYNAVDLEQMPEESVVDEIQQQIGKLEGVISSRVIEPTPEPGFYVVNGKN